jgi:hypothetical protein
MSSSERNRRSKRVRTLCAACQERKARFKYHGEVRADRDHTLCFECFRGTTNRARACRLAEGANPFRTPSPLGFQEAIGRRALTNDSSRTGNRPSVIRSGRQKWRPSASLDRKTASPFAEDDAFLTQPRGRL